MKRLIKELIEDSYRIINMHDETDMSSAYTRLAEVLRKYNKNKTLKLDKKQYDAEIIYIFADCEIKKYQMATLNGIYLGK